MAIKDWKKSKHHPTSNTKMAWDSKDGNHLLIIKNSSMSIPYRIILNHDEIDSTGTIVKARKIAISYMRKN